MRCLPKTLTFLCLYAAGFNAAQAELSPLLEHVYQLQCAKNQIAAEQGIEQLRNSSILSFGLPTENLNNNPDGFLTAGSLDITLHTLVNTATQYPALQNLVERTLLKWNYCHIFENNLFYDVFSNQTRHLVSYNSPLDWGGFKTLGFLDTPAKFIPALLSHSSSRDQAFETFFHRIYRQQCFPHPETGDLHHHLYQTKTQLRITNKTEHNNIYPYHWKTSCPTAEPIITAMPSPPIIPEITATTEPVLPAAELIISEVQPPEAAIEKTTPQPKPKIPVEKSVAVVKPIPPVRIKRVEETSIKAPTTIVIELPTPSNEQQPLINTATPVGTSNSAPIANVISEHPENTHGFTGNVYTKQSLSGNNPSIGASANWKPIANSFWFIRAGIDYDYKIDKPLTYSWGIGYDDWHEGTWSVQINNWGPIAPKEGLAWDKAIANIGYKFKSRKLARFNLHANASLDIPIKDNPILNLGLQWNPKENWYLRTNVQTPLDGSPTRWSYGFGYSNWRPGKFNIEYANYGPNTAFQPNIKENGIISISYNWEY